MRGISLEELYEFTTENHDSEFDYNGGTYILQPEWKDKKKYLVIWTCPPAVPTCIARREVPWGQNIPKDAIDEILSTKCFDGKSFLEIEQDVEVTYIH